MTKRRTGDTILAVGDSDGISKEGAMMKYIKIAVVEDNDGDAKTLTDLLSGYEKKTDNVKLSVKRFTNAVDFLEKYQPYDIVFMDIEMPMMSGMKACYKLREIDKNIVIIFVTNMEQFAVEGYLVSAFDFVVKPVAEYSFRLKMDRALDYISRFTGKTLAIKTPEGMRQIALQAIKYVDIMNYKLTYHTLDGDIEITTMKLQDVEPMLLGAGFFRCSRSLIVNMKYVKSVSETDMDLAGEILPISRRRKKDFMDALAEYFAGGGGNA